MKKPVIIKKKKNISNSTHINEAGFTNPFDEIGETSTDEYSIDDEDDPVYKQDHTTPIAIGSISLWNTNAKNKVAYKNGKMYANKYFCAGDIIEESPVKMMEEKDLYSENIRDCVFPIDTAKGLYALPLGYAVCYRNSVDAPVEGNISYEFDEDSNMLIFTAIKDIKKGNELVIAATDDDFANELRPGQFKYQQGVEPIYAVKNYKFV